MDGKIQEPDQHETQQHITEEAKPRVLICDDSRIVRASIIKHIKNAFDIREAGDGEAGWTTLNEDDTIQVLISDLSMPKLDGFGLLARLRGCETPRLREMPVIIISGEEESAVGPVGPVRQPPARLGPTAAAHLHPASEKDTNVTTEPLDLRGSAGRQRPSLHRSS